MTTPDPSAPSAIPEGRIAVVGSGFIGQSWAIVFARAGYEVSLFDAKREQLDVAMDYITSTLPDLEAAGLLGTTGASAAAALISPADDLAGALDGAVYVQENTPENPEIKRKVFAELDAAAAPGTILASSTSSIVPSVFSAGLEGAARCIVAHPINPPHLVPAVEIVPSEKTSPETIARTQDLMHAVGQSVVTMQKEIGGFIVNRLQGALLHEAFRLYAEGYADLESIDVCVRDGLGLRWSFMGPFETIDLNASGGIRDYIERYSGFYRELWSGPGSTDLPDWNAVRHEAEAERVARLPRTDLARRQAWRDDALIALMAGRRAKTAAE